MIFPCKPGTENNTGVQGEGETSITSDMQMTPPLWQKTKEPLDESERGE